MTSTTNAMVCILVATGLSRASGVAGRGIPPDGTTHVHQEESGLDLGPNVGTQPRPPRPASAAPETVAGEPPAPAAAEESRFHLSLGADWTTAYFSRGLRYEDSGLIVQPYADLSLDAFRSEDATLSLTLGTWNSFQGEATDAGTSDGFIKYWYESDLYAGVRLEAGAWALEARYYFYTSPSDAWETIEEFYLSAAYDDSDLLGAWSLAPSVILAVETGSIGADGGRDGTYLQLGVAPGFSFDAGSVKDVEVSFPASIGFSLNNYYEGANGENDTFGFANAGAQVSVPLNPGATGGAWALRAGVQCLFLGDAARSLNDDSDFEVIGSVGIAFDY